MHDKKTIRPVDRERMIPWLIKLLDGNSVMGLEWLDESKQMFKVTWKHASGAGWKLDDADVFRLWAQHTGRYDKEVLDVKTWKANFRCALHSVPDIKEIKDFSITKGSNAHRVFQIKGKKAKLLKKKRSKKKCLNVDKRIQDDQRVTMMCDNPTKEISEIPKPTFMPYSIPDFAKLEEDEPTDIQIKKVKGQFGGEIDKTITPAVIKDINPIVKSLTVIKPISPVVTIKETDWFRNFSTHWEQDTSITEIYDTDLTELKTSVWETELKLFNFDNICK